MTSQLDFQSFFIFIFFVPPTLDLKKISRKSTNKKNLALYWSGLILKWAIKNWSG